MDKKPIMASVAIILSACANNATSPSMLDHVVVPKNWSSQSKQRAESELSVDQSLSGWLAMFDDPQLNALVNQALQDNPQLKAQQATLAIAEQKAIIAGVTRYPELNLSQGNSRKKLVNETSIQYQNSASINLQLSYELDLWGKLSAEQNQASLQYLAAKNSYRQQQLQLVTDICLSWFNVIEAQQLLSLYQARADNLANNLSMMQSSYRLGLKQALDVYLAQNNVSSALARVAEQQQLLVTRKRTLELLLGEYPLGTISSKSSLPVVTDDLPAGVPAQLLTRRADILASWYQLLAADAGVAIAHKQRFPRFALTTTAGDSSDELSHLLDGGALAWSVIGNITMPLFNGGRLAALEQQAKLALQEKEHQYLDKVYRAFADVENAINNQDALSEQFSHLLQAQENATQAEKLSFDQYQRGLVGYTTVLESQRRAFDAQTSVIQVKNKLLGNRISLHLALGDLPSAETEQQTQSEDSPSFSF